MSAIFTAHSLPASEVVLPFGASKLASSQALSLPGQTIVQVCCGQVHSAILCGSGKVFTLGGNQSGQLGLGHYSSDDVGKPTAVHGLKTERVIQVACGGYHTLFLTAKGDVYACGRNDHGQLGQGAKQYLATATRVPGLAGIAQVAAGGLHSAVITGEGKVWVWGDNEKGQLGLGHARGQLSPVHCPVAQGAVAHVGCGVYYTAVITSRGELWMCGCNGGGKLGNKCGETSLALRRVAALTSPVAAVACGLNHTLALTVDGVVWAWGANSVCQRGVGDAKPNTTPQQVAALDQVRVSHIAVGDNHSAVITEGGELYTWGEGEQGKLCLKDKVNRPVPTRVTSLANYNVIQVSCGWLHTLVLASLKEELKVQQLDALTMNERDRLLQERDDSLKAKEQAYLERQQVLAVRESTVLRREHSLGRRDRELADQEVVSSNLEDELARREEDVKFRETCVAKERERGKELDAKKREMEESYLEKEKEMERRERLMEEKEKSGKEREAMIWGKIREMKLREGIMEEKDAEVRIREENVNRKEGEMESTAKDLVERERVVATREESIRLNEQALLDRERVSIALERVLAEKEGKLAETEGKLAEKEGKLAETEGKLAEKEGKLYEKERELEEKEGKMWEREPLLGEKESEPTLREYYLQKKKQQQVEGRPGGGCVETTGLAATFACLVDECCDWSGDAKEALSHALTTHAAACWEGEAHNFPYADGWLPTVVIAAFGEAFVLRREYAARGEGKFTAALYCVGDFKIAAQFKFTLELSSEDGDNRMSFQTAFHVVPLPPQKAVVVPTSQKAVKQDVPVADWITFGEEVMKWLVGNGTFRCKVQIIKRA